MPAIVGFGVAAELAAQRLAEATVRVQALRQRLEAGLNGLGATIFAVNAEKLPNTTYFAFADIDGETLVGGLYGVAVGGVFCGESMFSDASGGSKIAIAALCKRLAEAGVDLLDAQVDNPHLQRLGARAMPRAEYLRRLAAGTGRGLPVAAWRGVLAPVAATELA